MRKSFSEDLKCDDIPWILYEAFQDHVYFSKPFSLFQDRLLGRYIKSRPLMKEVFLEFEVQRMQRLLFYALKKLNLSQPKATILEGCQHLATMHDLYVERLERVTHWMESKFQDQSEPFATNPHLESRFQDQSEPFAINPHLQIVLNPEESFKDQKSLNHFYEGFLQYEVARYQEMTGKSLDESKESLLQYWREIFNIFPGNGSWRNL